MDRAWIGFLAFGAVIIGCYFLGDGGLIPSIVYEALAAVSAVAIVVGVRINRPEHRSPWFLLAGGQALFVIGDVLYTFYTFALGVEVPWPSLADPIYIIGYVLIIGGILQMVRLRSGGQDRAALLDSLVVSTALGSLLWIVTVSPYAGDTSLTFLEKVTSMSYPLMDLALLAVVIRLLISVARRTPANLLLTSAFVFLFAADVLYAIASLTGTYLGSGGFTTDGFWLISYVMAGAAALHPSMSKMFETSPAAVTLTRARIFLVVGSFLFIPVLLGVQSLLGQDLQIPVVVIASVTLTILLFARIEGLLKEIRSKVTLLETQQVTLEDSLSEARDAGRTTPLPSVPRSADGNREPRPLPRSTPPLDQPEERWRARSSDVPRPRRLQVDQRRLRTRRRRCPSQTCRRPTPIRDAARRHRWAVRWR